MSLDHDADDFLDEDGENGDDWFSEMFYDQEVASQEAEERLGRYYGGILHDDYSEESSP